MRLWSKYVDDVCLPAVLVQNWSRVMRPVAENWTDAELDAHLNNLPTQERRDIWRRMARQPSTAAARGAAVQNVRDMQQLQGVVEGRRVSRGVDRGVRRSDSQTKTKHTKNNTS